MPQHTTEKFVCPLHREAVWRYDSRPFDETPSREGLRNEPR